MKSLVAISVALPLAVAAAFALAVGSSGVLDSSFGGDGRVFASFSGFDTASGVVADTRGGVLVSGRTAGRVSLVRFDRRGGVDRAFGNGGLVREPVGSDPEEGVVRVVRQADGKIVFAGTTRDLNRDRQLGDGAVAIYRVLPDGKPDRSFGSRGTVFIRRSQELLGAELALDQAGRIVVVTRFQGLRRGGLLVLRLTTRGRLDASFGRNGQREVRFGQQSFLGSATVDRQGRVYVAGADLAKRTFSVLRLTARGLLDSGFGTAGIARLPHRGVLALPSAIVVEPAGRIVLAGAESFWRETAPAPCGFCDFLTLARLTPSGRTDRTFGTMGFVHTKLELTPSQGLGLAFQSDGRIVVVGGIQGERSASFLLVRLLRSGAFDPGLNGSGYVVTDMSSAKRKDSRATALVIAGDGRYVVAGRSARDALEGGGSSGRIQYRLAIARYLP